ncbi:MAG: (Fe-S)-binding protein [Pseudanabaena frigida]|uniref:(Fe-S)-binding protein n=1 Tax=Pseudanabaena frigida TaxID=945775 RepID=A0A2W4VUN2_9CYAN|nr:MAG: (Fe-S)-binding protein [Pseudanabaena frigida]
MSKLATEITDFQVVAKFLGVILKDGYRVKYLKVAIGDREFWIKLPKELSQSFDPNLSVGVWLEIRGTQQLERKKGILKLEASSFSIANAPDTSLSQAAPVTETNITKKKNQAACILICQKSDCWQSGGKEVYQRLEEELRDRGLSDRVQIQKTGCQKQCKQAPNLVIMPSKNRHSNVKPSQVDSLLDRYFDNAIS